MTSHALPVEPSTSDGDGGASIDRGTVNKTGAGAGCRVRKACVAKAWIEVERRTKLGDGGLLSSPDNA